MPKIYSWPGNITHSGNFTPVTFHRDETVHTNPNLKHRIDKRFEGKIQNRIPFSLSSVVQLE